MNRKTATLMGAAVAIAAGPAVATTSAVAAPAVPIAASYAELLQPIPNASERLKQADLEQSAAPARMIKAQWRDHHHHHHNHYRHYRQHNRDWYLSNGYYWHGGGWVLRPRHHHHHHHHHNHY